MSIFLTRTSPKTLDDKQMIPHGLSRSGRITRRNAVQNVEVRLDRLAATTRRKGLAPDFSDQSVTK